MISLIAAIATNGVIGKEDGSIPWKLKSDMRYFKSVTMGKPMIMGRKTFDTFGGRLLPGRLHIVVSRNVKDHLPAGDIQLFKTSRGNIYSTPRGELWVDNLETGIIAAMQSFAEKDDKNEIMIIGGGEIYRQAIPYCSTMYLTTVYASPEGSVKFPVEDIGTRDWFLKSRSAFPGDMDNDHTFDFAIWQRYGKPTKSIEY